MNAADATSDLSVDDAKTHDIVKEYYGKTLARSEDLQTTACCAVSAPTPTLAARLANLHEETLARFFGCGLIAPDALGGATVLDLGCGAGRDVYVLAQMVGEAGHVVGVDMTPEQLDVARRHAEWHRRRFGYAQSNVSFHHGLIEKLDALPLAPGTFDVAVSNCVINLVPDKPAALAGVRRLLKPGGEFYFSDVYADRPLTDDVRNDPVLYGECLGGALHWRDFLTIARNAGFGDPRLVEHNPIEPSTPELAERLGDARFASATYRLFAIDGVSEARDDLGHQATYAGGLDGAADRLVFDETLTLEKGAPTPIDANAARMLSESRFGRYVSIDGGGSRQGAFSSRVASPF